MVLFHDIKKKKSYEKNVVELDDVQLYLYSFRMW